MASKTSRRRAIRRLRFRERRLRWGRLFNWFMETFSALILALALYWLGSQ